MFTSHVKLFIPQWFSSEEGPTLSVAKQTHLEDCIKAKQSNQWFFRANVVWNLPFESLMLNLFHGGQRDGKPLIALPIYEALSRRISHIFFKTGTVDRLS